MEYFWGAQVIKPHVHSRPEIEHGVMWIPHSTYLENDPSAQQEPIYVTNYTALWLQDIISE